MQRLTPADREARRQDAAAALPSLTAHDVEGVALTWVDNAGVTRVKAVPTRRLPHAAAWGVGATTAFDAFLSDDAIMSGTYAGGPTGDLRLLPDLARLTVLHAQPGWAWAPVDRYRQDAEIHPQCARGLLRRVCAGLADQGYSTRAAFEVEWALGRDHPDGDEAFVAACAGPAYGMTRVIELSDYARDVLVALRTQGVEVEQFHPEYGLAQFELSVAATDPVAAADTTVLVRQTLRAVGQRHGLRTSFSPKVLLDGVGNGGHVHLSVAGPAGPLMSGEGPGGLSPAGAAFTAGILARLPALLTLGAPTAASYLRLVPSHWAGAFACWGPENREASLRVVRGSADTGSDTANLEVKCMDATANPYLLLAGLLVAGRAGMDEAATLPPPVTVDPAGVPPEERVARGIRPLPPDLETAATAFAADGALTSAFGPELATTLVEHRRAEAAATRDLTPEQIVRRSRWTH